MERFHRLSGIPLTVRFCGRAPAQSSGWFLNVKILWFLDAEPHGYTHWSGVTSRRAKCRFAGRRYAQSRPRCHSSQAHDQPYAPIGTTSRSQPRAGPQPTAQRRSPRQDTRVAGRRVPEPIPADLSESLLVFRPVLSPPRAFAETAGDRCDRSTQSGCVWARRWYPDRCRLNASNDPHKPAATAPTMLISV